MGTGIGEPGWDRGSDWGDWDGSWTGMRKWGFRWWELVEAGMRELG